MFYSDLLVSLYDIFSLIVFYLCLILFPFYCYIFYKKSTSGMKFYKWYLLVALTDICLLGAVCGFIRPIMTFSPDFTFVFRNALLFLDDDARYSFSKYGLYS